MRPQLAENLRKMRIKLITAVFENRLKSINNLIKVLFYTKRLPLILPCVEATEGRGLNEDKKIC